MLKYMQPPDFPVRMQPRCTPGSLVKEINPGIFRLEIPPGNSGTYRLAQLDDYRALKRKAFPHQPPLALSLKARIGNGDIPGTWGFGLWNDPFGFALPGAESGFRLPVFPNAAWFFYASEHNHLTLRDNLPGNGWMAAVYRSPGFGIIRLFPWLSLLPFGSFPPISGFLRRKAGAVLQHDAAVINSDPTEWHEYSLEIQDHQVRFIVDARQVLQTEFIPAGHLGVVVWIDNQYLSIPPDGRLRWGTLSYVQAAWLDIDTITLNLLGGSTSA